MTLDASGNLGVGTASPGASITEVAFELGFNDSAYFARCFRQQFGVPPRDWRRK
jgi:AraC-like DNA-binding protein